MKWPNVAKREEDVKEEKKEERAEVCPIQQETSLLVLELWLLGQFQLLQIVEQVVKGHRVLALGSVRIMWRQVGACEESLRLLERVGRLARAPMCPYIAQTLQNS
mgnify:FL=1